MLRMLALAALIASPAFADGRTPKLAFGYGLNQLDGPEELEASLHDFTLGVRVTKRDWVMLTYGRGNSFSGLCCGIADTKLWEMAVTIGRMVCKSKVCVHAAGRAGYQDASWVVLGDLFYPDTRFVEHTTAFGEAHVALRFDFDYVWIEASAGLRTHVASDFDLWRGGVVGVALYVTP